jgi:H/ACA ribonucleoprotein complex non-core subunit NAF1
MSNEPSSTLRQHPDNQVRIPDGLPDSQLHSLVQTKSAQEENLPPGHNFANLRDNKATENNIQIDTNQDCNMNGFILEFNKSSKLIDDEIDNISLSSEEDFKGQPKPNLDVESYEKETIKIGELYMNEDNDESMNKYIGTKNELSDVKVIPIVFPLEEGFNFLVAGYVMNKSYEGKFAILAETANGVLNLDNIIFNQNKLPVGYVDDVLGKIDSPLYVIKFFPDYSGNTDLKGEKLYVVKEKAKFVDKYQLVKMKGSDASNAFDEEVDDQEMEFSDDEEEKIRKEKLKKKKQNEVGKGHYQPNKDILYDNKQQNYTNQQYSNFNNSSTMINTNCQEYRLNTNFGPQNSNMFAQNLGNNFVQQQYFQNMQMFNPYSMFSPYQNQQMASNNSNQNNNLSNNSNQSNNLINNNNNQQSQNVNPQFFTHINPFIHNNFNK